MSDLAKNEYTKNYAQYLEGFPTIESLISHYNEENSNFPGPEITYVSAYFLILNPDHPRYEGELTNLECDTGAHSIHFGTIHTGFIEGEGEAGRVILIPKEMSEEELWQIMHSIIFDLYRIK